MTACLYIQPNATFCVYGTIGGSINTKNGEEFLSSCTIPSGPEAYSTWTGHVDAEFHQGADIQTKLITEHGGPETHKHKCARVIPKTV